MNISIKYNLLKILIKIFKRNFKIIINYKKYYKNMIN